MNATLNPQMRRMSTIMRGDPENPDEVLGVLNPAAARAPDGTLYLFPRVVAAGNYSRIGVARVIFDDRGEPVAVERMGYALEPTESYERNARTAGCEDPRITYVGAIGCYVIVYRSPTPILAPEIEEERSGVVPNVVFPTAVDPRENGVFDVYYGMADAAIGVARLTLG